MKRCPFHHQLVRSPKINVVQLLYSFALIFSNVRIFLYQISMQLWLWRFLFSALLSTLSMLGFYVANYYMNLNTLYPYSSYQLLVPAYYCMHRGSVLTTLDITFNLFFHNFSFLFLLTYNFVIHFLSMYELHVHNNLSSLFCCIEAMKYAVWQYFLHFDET